MNRKTLIPIAFAAGALLASAPLFAQTSVDPSAVDSMAPAAEDGPRLNRRHRGAHHRAHGERGARHQGARALHEFFEINMDLGRYYLMSGDYQQAADHFLAVAEFELPARPEASEDSPRAERRQRRQERIQARAEAGQAAIEAPADGDRAENRRERRHERRAHRHERRAERFHGRLEHQRLRAYTMAATAQYLAGDVDRAMSIAGEGLALVDPDAPAAEQGEVHTPIERFIADPDAFSARFAEGPVALERRLLEIETRLGNNGPR